MTPLTEQERAEARAMALDVVNGTAEAEWGADWYMTMSRALLDADQRITDLTRERDEMRSDDVQDLWRAVKESDRRAVAAEAQLAACREALRRFLEWDALTALPDPLPAPFADLPYWLGEFRRALSDGGSET